MIIYCKNLRLANQVKLADTFFTRLIGLMGKKHLSKGEGLLLLNCPSIHCFFMKIAIDAVYLSADNTVVGVETLTPWQIGRHFKNTKSVLELPAGEAVISVGDRLAIYREVV